VESKEKEMKERKGYGWREGVKGSEGKDWERMRAYYCGRGRDMPDQCQTASHAPVNVFNFCLLFATSFLLFIFVILPLWWRPYWSAA